MTRSDTMTGRVSLASLGHASIAVTMNLYGHLTRNLQGDAADEFDRALTNG